MTTSPEAPSSLPGASAERVPDFFIVGHHKCGTTALYEMLRRHPQIYMPDVKEPWFLAEDLPLRFEPQTWLPTTLPEYLSLFAPAGPDRIAGEATPSYLFSHAAAARIAELQPNARIIAILREPAAFLRSLHLQSVRNHAETEADFGKALALEELRREGRAIPTHAERPQELLYSEHVRYVEQLRRYHAVFAPEQVLTLIYEDFRADNEGTVRQVLRFLDVDDGGPIEPTEANPSVGVRSPQLYELVRSLYLGRGPAARAAKASIKVLTPQRVRRDGLVALRRRVLYGEPPAPDPALMGDVRRRFKGEVQALSEYLGRDLVSQWGYDAVE
ncbi:MAG TPA: sulfotransferase [Solirubrobacteraceae bacterium]|jgi:hypothetical protein